MGVDGAGTRQRFEPVFGRQLPGVVHAQPRRELRGGVDPGTLVENRCFPTNLRLERARVGRHRDRDADAVGDAGTSAGPAAGPRRGDIRGVAPSSASSAALMLDCSTASSRPAAPASIASASRRMIAAAETVASATAARGVEAAAELSRRNAGHRGNRRRAGQAEAGKRRADPDLALQPRVGVGVPGAVLAAGRQRQAAGLARRRGHRRAAVTGQRGRRADGDIVVVGTDDQGARRCAHQLVECGGRAAEHLADRCVGRQRQRRQQHRAVAAFQQREVARHQHDACRGRVGIGGPSCGDRHGQRILVRPLDPSLTRRPWRQIGADRDDVRHGLASPLPGCRGSARS